jgi:hypothetical protein
VAPHGPTTSSDNSYLDLKPGGELKVVVPLKAGKNDLIPIPGQGRDGSLVLSAPGLAGYQISHYSVAGRIDGTVRIRFQSAETVRDGKTTPTATKAPELPFALPAKRAHVRLLYLVRQSRSDHNMAIVAGKSPEDLNSFTQTLKTDPNRCKTEGKIFCAWVPAGVAVRAE